MALVAKSTSHGNRPAPQPRVLVVDDEPNLVELVSDVVRGMNCRIATASTVAEGRRILAAEDVDVLVTDVHLPDGDGTTLLAALHRRRPSARAVVITGSPSVASAITAIREGAVDFVPKPFDNDQIVRHVRKALDAQAHAAKAERKVERLRVAVRRLNEARRTISKKVDILCNDLVSAYGELSRQLDSVRTQEGFRKSIEHAADLEQLLCHAMDWLLRQVGYSNVAVWLAAEDGEFQLGAYMKYTTPGEPALTEAMRRVLLPLAARASGDLAADAQAHDDGTDPAEHGTDGVVRLRGNELIDRLTPDERPYFRGADLLAANCTYLGESLAALVFMRDAKRPFTPEDEALLRAVGPVFAVALASVVRAGDEDGDDRSSDDADDATPTSRHDDDDDGKSDTRDRRDDGDRPRGGKGGRKPQKPDPADWWKNGQPPPF